MGKILFVTFVNLLSLSAVSAVASPMSKRSSACEVALKRFCEFGITREKLPILMQTQSVITMTKLPNGIRFATIHAPDGSSVESDHVHSTIDVGDGLKLDLTFRSAAGIGSDVSKEYETETSNVTFNYTAEPKNDLVMDKFVLIYEDTPKPAVFDKEYTRISLIQKQDHLLEITITVGYRFPYSESDALFDEIEFKFKDGQFVGVQGLSQTARENLVWGSPKGMREVRGTNKAFQFGFKNQTAGELFHEVFGMPLSRKPGKLGFNVLPQDQLTDAVMNAVIHNRRVDLKHLVR